MKRTVIYWKTTETRRKEEIRKTLGITCESVNKESDYIGDPGRLGSYVEEGLITIRIKEYEERRIKEVRVDTKQSQPYNRQKIGRGGRKRKV